MRLPNRPLPDGGVPVLADDDEDIPRWQVLTLPFKELEPEDET
ncbi:hypothetical protein [Streptomyces goshikiensis]